MCSLVLRAATVSTTMVFSMDRQGVSGHPLGAPRAHVRTDHARAYAHAHAKPVRREAELREWTAASSFHPWRQFVDPERFMDPEPEAEPEEEEVEGVDKAAGDAHQTDGKTANTAASGPTRRPQSARAAAGGRRSPRLRKREPAVLWRSMQLEPHETPMSLRMAARKRWLTEQARRAAPSMKLNSGPITATGASIGTAERPANWLDTLLNENAFARASVDVNKRDCGREGNGKTLSADGKFHPRINLKAGHYSLARFSRGVPSGYSGFVPQHIMHDHPHCSASYKIGFREPETYLGRYQLQKRVTDADERRYRHEPKPPAPAAGAEVPAVPLTSTTQGSTTGTVAPKIQAGAAPAAGRRTPRTTAAQSATSRKQGNAKAPAAAATRPAPVPKIPMPSSEAPSAPPRANRTPRRIWDSYAQALVMEPTKGLTPRRSPKGGVTTAAAASPFGGLHNEGVVRV